MDFLTRHAGEIAATVVLVSIVALVILGWK
jgi:hypothetical protein